MAWIVNNFECLDCSLVFEELYKNGEEDSVECTNCHSVNKKVIISSPRLSTFEMADKEGKAAILRKRSADHTKKMLLKDADQFAGHGMQRRAEYLGKK